MKKNEASKEGKRNLRKVNTDARFEFSEEVKRIIQGEELRDMLKPYTKEFKQEEDA